MAKMTVRSAAAEAGVAVMETGDLGRAWGRGDGRRPSRPCGGGPGHRRRSR